MTAGDAANGAGAYYYDAFTQRKSPETSQNSNAATEGAEKNQNQA
jgi:hypothetical protein